MKLTKFKLVNHEGLTGLNYKGRTIPFDKLDDAKAEELFGKTHVLERVSAAPSPAVEQPASPSEAAAGAEASDLSVTEGETAATRPKRSTAR